MFGRAIAPAAPRAAFRRKDRRDCVFPSVSLFICFTSGAESCTAPRVASIAMSTGSDRLRSWRGGVSYCMTTAVQVAAVVLAATAATPDGIPDGRAPVAADLVAADLNVSPGRTLLLGVRFRVEEGWHLYWRNPGDSGAAPSVEWRLPPGFTSGEMEWPAPSRFGSDPVGFGYAGETALILPVTAPPGLREGERFAFSATVDWVACGEICEAGRMDLRIELPVGPAAASVHAGFLRGVRERMPMSPPPEFAFDAFPDGASLILRAPAAVAEAGLPADALFLFPAKPDLLVHAAPQRWTRLPDGRFEGRLRRFDATARVDRVQGVLAAGGRAWTVDCEVKPKEGVKP